MIRPRALAASLCYARRMMSPHDQERFATLIGNFVDRSDIAHPFHLVAIGSNGSVSVCRSTESGGIEEVCATTPGDLASPVLVTVIGMDGAGASVRINVEAPRPTMQ